MSKKKNRSHQFIGRRQGVVSALKYFYLAPIFILYALALFFPLLITIRYGVKLGISGWLDVLRNPLFIHALINTLVYSLTITVVATALAYTVATAIWRSGILLRTIITSVVLLSFWMPILVKVVSWDALLRNNGVLNTMLLAVGIIDEPLRLFPGTSAVILGMIQFVLPFAVFPILGVMLRLDRKLEYAAKSLGSTSWRVFRHIIFPLTLPGVLAAAMLVFVICTGFYVIPALLGKPNNAMLSNVVALFALQLVNFKVASGIAMILLAIVAMLTFVYQHVDRKIT